MWYLKGKVYYEKSDVHLLISLLLSCYTMELSFPVAMEICTGFGCWLTTEEMLTLLANRLLCI